MGDVVSENAALYGVVIMSFEGARCRFPDSGTKG